MVETRQMEVDGRMVFDHRTEIRDPRTGKTILKQDYILHVNGSGHLYESPPHSGKFFDGQGKLAKDLSKDVIAAEEAKKETPVAVAAEEKAPVLEDPVKSAEAEAKAILEGARNTYRKKV